MKYSILCASLCVALCSAVVASPMEAEDAKPWGHINVNLENPAEVSTIVYDNITGGTANAGFSSTDLTATFGEPLTLAGTGVVSEHAFSVFNSGSSAGPLTTATATIRFYVDDNPTGLGTFIGGYSTNFSFGAGLAPGFFGTIGVTGLEGLGIDLSPNTSIVVTQELSNIAGGANRLGVVSILPTTVGANPFTGMYIDASTVGAPGYYNITSGGVPIEFNVANTLSVVPIPEPSSLALAGLGLVGLAIAIVRGRRS